MATAQNKLGGGRLARHVLPNSWQVADTPNQLVDCQVHVFSHNESKELKVVSHDVPQCFGGIHLLFLSLCAQLSILSKFLLCVAAATPGVGRVARAVACSKPTPYATPDQRARCPRPMQFTAK